MSQANFNYALSIVKELQDRKDEFEENGVCFSISIVDTNTGDAMHILSATEKVAEGMCLMELHDLWQNKNRHRLPKISIHRFANTIPLALEAFHLNSTKKAD